LKYYLFFTVLLLLSLSACVKYSTYEITVSDDEKDINQKNLQRVFQTVESKDTLTIIFTGDSQRFYDETTAFKDAVNQEKDIDFVIFAGDLTDFGIIQEYQAMHNIFKELNIPYLCVVGNHDFNYNGGEIFLQMYGPYDFAFTLHDFRFVFLNSNGREFGWNGEVPNIPWLTEQLADTSNYFGAIVVNHVAPGHVDFDSALEESYVEALHQAGKTMMQLNGHNHDFAESYPYYGDIHYINSYSTQKRKYIKLKIWKGPDVHNSHSMEIISF